MNTLKAGVTYFAIIFALGFAFGTIRVLILLPHMGEMAAVLMEGPFILGASWFVCTNTCPPFRSCRELGRAYHHGRARADLAALCRAFARRIWIWTNLEHAFRALRNIARRRRAWRTNPVRRVSCISAFCSPRPQLMQPRPDRRMCLLGDACLAHNASAAPCCLVEHRIANCVGQPWHIAAGSVVCAVRQDGDDQPVITIGAQV